MSDRDPFDPERSLGAWRAAAVPVRPRPRDDEQRGRMISAMRAVIMAESARKQRVSVSARWFALGAAALLILGVGLASWRLGVDMGQHSKALLESNELSVSGHDGGVVTERAGVTRVLEPRSAATLATGDGLETLASGRAELSTDHSHFRLASATRVELVGAGRTGERLRLSHGKIDVDVQHSKDRSVVVETPQAQVLVVGTAFSVSVDGEGSTGATAVLVTRGTVLVVQGERRALVHAGEGWSSRQEPALKNEDSPSAAVKSSSSAVPSPSSLGTLAEENRLFNSALEARNRGELATAAELFAELLRRFPRAVMSEEASLERLRALDRLGRKQEASGEARRYLARFRGGNGEAEARRILNEN